ncbi:MAG TPA: ABC transporter ATP-binding protein [Actinomycetes bacterium]|nr:ABC transporter ATP-binding protein [Actinomycetes bacterium]
MSSAPTISMRGITKRFAGATANADIDLDLSPGEVHALLGENGAGKTTLMSILFGLLTPDAGEISVDGRAVRMRSPHQALEMGIGMVHQHFMLVPTFTVTENIVLGAHFGRGPVLRAAAAERRVRETAERFDIAVDPRVLVGDLPVETKQRVEILKLLHRGASTLILDEPTSVLGPAEREALFATLSQLRERGASIVIVTHKLAEVMSIADRVTILRAGRKVLAAARGDYDARTLAHAMVPQEVGALPARATTQTSDRPARLAVDALTVLTDGTRSLDGVTLQVLPGEVLGVAGVAGNGQQELMDALAGLRPVDHGRIRIDGADLTAGDTRTRRQAGLGVIPADRQGWGIAASMSVAENLTMTRVGAGETGQRRGFTLRTRRAQVDELIVSYEIRPTDPTLPVGALSGGNQQKVVVARELERRPRVLLVANPTQGLDIGAAALVHRKLIEARNAGCAILLVSNDLDELRELSDRLVVLFGGRIVLEGTSADLPTPTLASAMAGALEPDPVP